MATTLPILIAGGGIGGLAAAYALGLDGHQVTVLEQSSAFGEIGAGIQLGPNAFRVFDYLGLTEAINKVAYFPPHMDMKDVRTGEQIVRLPLGDASRAAYGVIYQVDIHQVLLDACMSLPNITLTTNAKVASYDQSNCGTPTSRCGAARRPTSCITRCAGANCSIWSRCSTAASTTRAGTRSATRPSCRNALRRPCHLCAN
jgi:salicylate hydroxylase